MKKSLFTLLALMLLGTASYAQWPDDPNSYFQTQFYGPQYQFNANMVAVIAIDGVIQTNLSLELGAWNTVTEVYCGGHTGAYYNAYPDAPTYYLTYYGYNANDPDGNPQSIITFRIYDQEEEEVLLDYVCDYTIEFVSQQISGSPSQPVLLNFYTQKEMHFEGLADNDWSNAANWTADGEAIGRVPYAGENVFIDAPCVLDIDATAATVTVSSGASLTIGDNDETGDLSVLTTELTIKDGGQFFAPSGSEYVGTLEKEILGYGNTSLNNYYLISVPVTDFDNATGFEAAGMLNGDYDLYFWTQNGWRN